VVRCSDEAVIIEVEDALTRKTVQRSIDAPPVGHPEREREVVLAVSSLIVASWMELFVPVSRSILRCRLLRRTPPRPSASSNEPCRPDPVPHCSSSPPFAGACCPKRSRCCTPACASAASCTAAGRCSATPHSSTGRAERTRGQIDGYAALFGPGVAWTLRPDKDFGLEIWGALSGGYVRLAGRPSMADVDAGAVGGTTGEVELGLGPRFRASSFVMVLDVRSGYTIENPRGIVTDEIAVTFGGFWVGVGLRVGGLLGRRMD
jgi:hypothetical protein